MPIDRSKMRRGGEAIDEAVASRGERGDFKPFLPSIYWDGDKVEHYVLILNPMEDIPQVDFHPFVDTGDGIPHQIIARTDPILGESRDPIEDQWQYNPRLTNLAVAVMLEPITEVVNKRTKPVGFEVATKTFERRIRDDSGELTDEKEEVTAPVVGFITQSPMNFFNQLRHHDATESSIHTTPLKITRLGVKDNVTYTVKGYETAELKLDNLLDFVENISYVQKPEELLEAIEGLDDQEAAVAIGNYILDLKIDELADAENYNALFEAITKPARFPKKGKGKEKAEKTQRPARQSQRRTARAEAETEAEVEATEAEATDEPAAEEKPKTSDRQARLEGLRTRAKNARKSGGA